MSNLKMTPKTETVSEFLARGGEIKKMSTKKQRKVAPRDMKEGLIEDSPDFAFLPVALKIRYGIKV